MQRHQRMTCAAAALALAVSVLAGCSGGDPAPPQTSAPASSPTTSTSSTTSTPPTASTTSAGPAFPAGLPDAAKTKDKAGAEAFLRYFVSSLNEAWTKAEPEKLEGLCLPSSEACASWRSDAEELNTLSHHYVGAPITLESVKPLSVAGRLARFSANVTQERRDVVDSKGRIVKTDERADLKMLALLKWTGFGWQLASFGTVS